MIYIKKLYTTLRYRPDRENQTASHRPRAYARRTSLSECLPCTSTACSAACSPPMPVAPAAPMKAPAARI